MPAGRPRKVYSKNAAVDAEYHKPHVSWDFTDPCLYVDGAVSDERLEAWRRWCGEDGCKYLEIAGEAGETGYLHGQGRVVFRRAYRLPQLKKLFAEVHWEPTLCKQDCLYLRKHDSTTLLHYDGRRQGARNIFADQTEAIRGGANLRECATMDGANYQSIRSAELLMAYIEPERPQAARDVNIVSGPAAPMPAAVYRLRNAAFWDGYDAHKAIYVNQALLKLSRPMLAQILGPAPFRAGRCRQALYDTVYISGVSSADAKALGLHLHKPSPWELLRA